MTLSHDNQYSDISLDETLDEYKGPEKLTLQVPQRNNTVVSRHTQPGVRKFQWGTLTPFIWAFVLTFGPTLGLLIYLLVTKVADVGACGTSGHGPCPFYGNVTLGERTLIISEPLGRFLTVTKVVDTVQQLAITWVLALAAFSIAESWLTNNALTTRTLALVINMYASGRWWALWESFHVIFSKKKGHSSRTFVHALIILLIALLLSKLATGADLWIHYASKEAIFAIGQNTPISTQQLWSRQINNTCRVTNDGVVNTGFVVPCTIVPSSLGTALSFPALAAALSTNASISDEVALVFDGNVSTASVGTSLGYSNLAIVVPKSSAVERRVYNASTIGVSTFCKSVTNACLGRQIPHGSSTFNCTGKFNGSEATEFYYNFPAGNSAGILTMGTGGDSPISNPTVRYISQLLIAGNGSEFVGGSAQARSLLNVQQCTIGIYYVNYTSAQYGSEPRVLTINSRQLMDLNSSTTISAASIQSAFEDSLSASKGAAQVSSEAFDWTNAYEISRYSLSYAAGAWSEQPSFGIEATPEARAYSCIPLAPVAIFFALIFAYSIFVILLFVWSTRTGKQIINIMTTGTVKGNENPATQETVTMTELAQRRLVRTDFLLYQLLSEDGHKSTKTDADDVMRGEDSQIAVAELVDGRFGVYASGKDGEASTPTWGVSNGRSFRLRSPDSQRSLINPPSATSGSTRYVPRPSKGDTIY
ncbi:hypothetical protein BCR37DRAFT_375556 [Protomyces lactucae-debilis]|uniref:Uncharacterized protein n=1 Tax=Protomyces lactucae-debilis TaxID=2754530 RepID=A0A1Y2FUI8_PROLT|nr:uncharacterized protein BCR37DRAFT_375556 [Protomyces lactucae-debilis]ORY87681.1 hypothetical protein BCR37DRAFT_375556 [Protomyces lactucae-debilis]